MNDLIYTNVSICYNETLNNTILRMYLAYLNIETKDGVKCFAIYGKDSEEIYFKALKYGTDPYFVSSMYTMNSDWVRK